MIGVPQKTIESWGTTIDDKNTSVASQVVYEKLYKASISAFIDEGKTAFKEKLSVFKEAFVSRVSLSDSGISCDINIGVFWDSTDEADDFLEMMKSRLKDVSDIGWVVFAALNIEKANILADIILDEVGDILHKGTMCPYSLKDDCYYTYPDCEVTNPRGKSNPESGEYQRWRDC